MGLTTIKKWCSHVLDSIIRDWWILRNVRSHQQTMPKFWAKTNLIGPLLPKKWSYHYNNRGLFYDPHIIANNKERRFRKPAFTNHNSSQIVKPLRYENIRTRIIASPSQLPNLIQSQTFYDSNCFYMQFAIDITSETICNKPIATTTWRIDSKVYRFPK